MTVVIVVPGQAEPWQVANSAFRLLVDEVRDLRPPVEALQLILGAQIFQTLDLAAMGVSERAQVTAVLAESARRLGRRLVDQGPAGEWEAGLIHRLGVLEMWMEGLLDEQ